MPSFTVKDIPDLTNRTYLVTGGNAGIGYEVVKALAAKNAKVYLAARSEEKALSAIKEIKETYPTSNIIFHKLDLGTIKDSINSARLIKDSLDVLICNAGISMEKYQLTAEGYEKIFSVNHLAHFAFVTEVLKTQKPRVVITASAGEAFAPKEGINFDSIKAESGPDSMPAQFKRYAQSKLANFLFAYELRKRFNDIKVYALHPGGVGTKLGQYDRSGIKKYLSPIISTIWGWVSISPADGARTTLFCATTDDLDDSKPYAPYGDVFKHKHPLFNDPTLAGKLWDFSEKAVKQHSES